MLGLHYKVKGNYDKAMRHYLVALNIFNELSDLYGQAETLNNIGNIYKRQGDYDKAMEYFVDSKNIKEKINNHRGLGISYNNIGILAYLQKNYDEALKNYKKSLALFTHLNNTYRIARLNYYIGQAYHQKEDYEKALDYYQTALQLRQEIDDRNGVVNSLHSLSLLFMDFGQYQEAGNMLEKARALAREIDANHLEIENYLYASKLDSIQGNYLSALVEFKKYAALRDSVFGLEKSKQIAELQTKYETEKKDREIALQKEVITKRNMQRNYLLIASLLGLVLVVVLYKNNRRKQKTNLLLQEQKDEIEEKNVELEQQKEEILTQAEHVQRANDKIVLQKDAIEAQAKQITSSINYASRIQNAVLPSTGLINSTFRDSFVLYKPKDIVSGDFYWMKNIGHKVFIAAADCTGHGVPGAFMSMLGITLLNETVTRLYPKQALGNKGFSPPGAHVVLNELREQVKTSLGQTGKRKEIKDGMDMTFCILDLQTKQLGFAGAYNRIFLFQGDEMLDVRGDRMPIGFHRREKNSFTQQTFQLQEGNEIYFFTDGYIDQFGGTKGDKFKRGRFMKILRQIHGQPMKDQAETLEKYYKDWKGNRFKQIDDILVCGIRI
jgi:serine phosphatase RsbU (regulator of sigma subunit)